MIEATNLTKKFDDLVAVDHINAEIGKAAYLVLSEPTEPERSTFLRLAAGVLKPDEGRVTIDGEEVFENEAAKRKSFSIFRTIRIFSAMRHRGI